MHAYRGTKGTTGESLWMVLSRSCPSRPGNARTVEDMYYFTQYLASLIGESMRCGVGRQFPRLVFICRVVNGKFLFKVFQEGWE